MRREMEWGNGNGGMWTREPTGMSLGLWRDLVWPGTYPGRLHPLDLSHRCGQPDRWDICHVDCCNHDAAAAAAVCQVSRANAGHVEFAGRMTFGTKADLYLGMRANSR